MFHKGCLSSKATAKKHDDSLISSIVAGPTPAQIDMLFIDMGEVDYEPSQFLSSIDGERLHLIKNGSGQADSIYLPKQITCFGIIVLNSITLVICSLAFIQTKLSNNGVSTYEYGYLHCDQSFFLRVQFMCRFTSICFYNCAILPSRYLKVATLSKQIS